MGSISNPPQGNADRFLGEGSHLNQGFKEVANTPLLAAVMLQRAPN